MPDTRPWLAHYPPQIPATIEYREAPLYTLLENAAHQYPDLPALRFYGVRLTYAVLWAQAQRLAAALSTLGVSKGDRVALMLPNCPQYVIAYYGVLRAGGIVAQVNPLYTPRELEHLLDDCGARVIVVADALYPVVQAANLRLKSLDHIVVVSLKGDVPLAADAQRFEEVLARSNTPPPASRSTRTPMSPHCSTRAARPACRKPRC